MKKLKRLEKTLPFNMCYCLPKLKKCSKCGEEKSSDDDFYSDKMGADGRSTICKVCKIEQIKAIQSKYRKERELYAF